MPFPIPNTKRPECSWCHLEIGPEQRSQTISDGQRSETYHDCPGSRCFDRELSFELKRDVRLILNSRKGGL